LRENNVSPVSPESASPATQESDSRIRTYVTRGGRLTEAQKRALDTYGADYMLPFSPSPLDTAALFTDPGPLIIEIGFGMGNATWQIAKSRPEFNYLGIEVHTPGVGRLMMELSEKGIGNVKIIQHDAVEVLERMIPDACISGFHVFYPDPWPKKRHHKRRLMRPYIVELMIDKLAKGGYIYFVTDIEEYAQSSMAVLYGARRLSNRFKGYAHGIDWRPETKFGMKAKAQQRSAFELFYVKN